MSGTFYKMMGGAMAAGGGYFLLMRSSQPTLVRANSDAGANQKRLVRRHSSGDHAFLPSKTDRAAIRSSQKDFGVPKDMVQDAEGLRLPTTRGY